MHQNDRQPDAPRLAALLQDRALSELQMERGRGVPCGQLPRGLAEPLLVPTPNTHPYEHSLDPDFARGALVDGTQAAAARREANCAAVAAEREAMAELKGNQELQRTKTKTYEAHRIRHRNRSAGRSEAARTRPGIHRSGELERSGENRGGHCEEARRLPRGCRVELEDRRGGVDRRG